MLNNKGAMVALTSLLFLAAAFSKDLELKKKVGDYQVEIKIDKNPPVIGDNKIEIQIKDASDGLIEDAKVLVNYYMPPMPRMAP
ncbi:MAG: FixH family protein, partial [Candidatus Aminicenantes bacterium]|nr:FixH family protein [Candidatus Aminicenantes bacterium]